MAVSDQNSQLRLFYERRHPDYSEKLPHWRFLESTYTGGREWFANNIFSYHKEGPTELAKRIERAYRFNHTREAVDLVQKYLFKAEVIRKEENATSTVIDFWKRATISNFDISQFMRLAGTANSISGRVGIIVDNNFVEGAKTIAQVKESNSRIYAYEVTAKDILDLAWDEDGDGRLLWIKIRERYRDDADPLTSSGEVVDRVRLWTRTGWQLFQEVETTSGKNKGNRKIVLIDSGDHNLGRVPCVLMDHMIGTNLFSAPGLIDDIAYLDRAIANYLSNLDAIIQDQTFSQLAMPAQGLLPGDETYNKVLELGTKRVFVYDGGSGSTAKPEYLSPDPKQAGMILTVINKIINEIYNTIGLSGERTKEDNAVGIDNSSGVAKAYDFERVNSLLISKAKSCEIAENEIVALVSLWAGEKVPEEDLVSYPSTFDVMRLADELTIAEALSKIIAPIEVRRQQMKQVVEKLFPQLSEEDMNAVIADTDKWLEGTDVLPEPPTAFGTSKTTPSRQGQVTSKTK